MYVVNVHMGHHRGEGEADPFGAKLIHGKSACSVLAAAHSGERLDLDALGIRPLGENVVAGRCQEGGCCGGEGSRCASSRSS